MNGVSPSRGFCTMSDRVDMAVSALSVKPEDPMTQVTDPPARIDQDLVAQLCGGARADGISIDGEGGLLAQMTKLVVESALEGEMTDHLGYDKHAKGASANGNARNGTRSKTIATKAGPVEIDVPRDRAGTFTPQIVKKRQRRLGSTCDVVLSLSARGMTHGDITPPR